MSIKDKITPDILILNGFSHHFDNLSRDCYVRSVDSENGVLHLELNDLMSNLGEDTLYLHVDDAKYCTVGAMDIATVGAFNSFMQALGSDFRLCCEDSPTDDDKAETNGKPEETTVEVERITPWSLARDAARRTIGKEPLPRDKEVSSEFKLKSCFAEHSQIKLVQYRISFKALRQWVGVHLLRHPFVLPFIHSQRVDRRADIEELTDKVMSIISDDIKAEEGFNRRDYLFQGERNDQDFYVNAQTLINISRKRLCHCASKETRQAWEMVKEAIAAIDPEVAHCMVPNCVYRSRCPEMSSCGYWKTRAFREEYEEYWSKAPCMEKASLKK